MSTTQETGTRTGTGWDPLVAVSLVAGVGFTATAEYDLARTIGAAVPVAVLLPLALDVYVVAAIRRARGRDIALSLVLMGTAQVAAHMLAAHVVAVSVPLVAAVSLLVPLSIWRVHALAVPATKKQAKPGTGAGAVPAADIERVPVPEAVPARPELTAVPEMTATPVPVRRSSRVPARKTAKKTGTAKTSTASFEEHVRTATGWLQADPDLSGTAIGNRLGTGDSYGRRVRRAALDTTPGPERPAGPTAVGQGGGGYN
ncbi:hypothetical protein CG740_23205 [Streptomyces sp. CB01201]|uniref:hypothetical protein n=1 Tax=Streptomyces sp. CB01201 TaxID=2020324 RepID=UPI000C278D20|nr:hypothetical protein [Streptomyces sp. CB01201]PJN00816.1 hypothetical protein CG740_23205 [Streptomyces sp. CB01201]